MEEEDRRQEEVEEEGDHLLQEAEVVEEELQHQVEAAAEEEAQTLLFFFQGKIKELVHLFDSSHLPQLEEALEWPQEEEEGLNSSRLPVDESNRQSVDANRQSASRTFEQYLEKRKK